MSIPGREILLKTQGMPFLELRDWPMGILEDGVFLFGVRICRSLLGRGCAPGWENDGQASRRVSTRQAESLRHKSVATLGLKAVERFLVEL